MQKIFNVLISITLSETEKRVLFIVFLLFILLLFLVGLLTHLNDKMIIKQGRKLDKHVSGYVKYGFATNEKEFKKVAKHKNHLLLLKQMVPAIIIIGVTLTAFFIYLNITKQSFSYIWDIYYDMLLRFEVKTTTVLGFIEVWEEWPKLTEDSFVFHGTFEAIVAYIFLLLMIVGFFFYFRATFNFIARTKRYKDKSKDIFESDIEKEVPVANDTLDNASTPTPTETK